MQMRECKTALSLPFKGTWLVVWGGNTRRLNHHHEIPNQRFAFDFSIVGKNGKSYRHRGKKRENYHAFGQEVLAPAYGRVVEAIDGVRDNVPGSMNPDSAIGNAVVIEHAKGEVSVLAHLQCGSVAVRAGAWVMAGQPIGLCGNSGNSSEPHLHYHLQDSPILQEGRGIRCSFQRILVTRDGKTAWELRHAPVKGELVSPRNR